MDGDVKTFRAAQVVRMSTEHQQYSTGNQGDKIKEYADKRGIEIVRTYADDGKSGLSIGGRASLQKLLADVESGAADYTLILVYDVSRWGHHRWKVRFDTSLAPDITVAVRLDTANQAALDYYLLPRLDFGQNRISLAEQNAIEFESYRFDSLDYLYRMAARTRVRSAA